MILGTEASRSSQKVNVITPNDEHYAVAAKKVTHL
jgi:hypothetical protein